MPAADARPDITGRPEIEQLVRTFYGRAMADELLGPIFVDVAHLDLEAHVPEISSFWETILLGAKTYRSSAFEPHQRLNAKVTLEHRHFERWLQLWFGTVDDLFAGETANAAKVHALRVAQGFMGRLATHPAPAE
jgi:hemoglobin